MLTLWSRSIFAGAYLLSSFAALSFEILWTRALVPALGSTVEAAACVLGAFMVGLAAGAWLGARLGERLDRPLGAFALLQLAGAAGAFLPLAVLDLPATLAYPAGSILVMVAALPLGFGFPLGSRVRALDPSGQGARPGRLAALDTTGAFLGSLATGLVLLPALGVRVSLAIGAGVRIGAAGIAWMLRRLEASPARGSQKVPPGPEPKGEMGRLVGFAAALGFCLLGAEVLWSRLLALVLFQGSTTYALTAMLASVLLGSSLGGWFASRRTSEDPRLLAPRCGIALGAALTASLAWALWVGPAGTPGRIPWADVGVTLLACVPASFFSGAGYAAVCRAAVGEGAARGPGRMLAANALGAFAGASLAGLVLIPLVGLAAALALVAAAAIGTGLLAGRGAGRLGAGWIGLAAIAAAGAGICAAAGPLWIRHLGNVIYYHEGSQATVAVVEEPDRTRRLFVDGISVAGTDLIMATDQKTLAHLPVSLHPAPAKVLTVGFGSGGTSHSLLLHPDLEVHCAEISPGVLGAAPALTQANHDLLGRDEPRFKLHRGDARRFLASTPERFDVIVSDCTDLAYRGDAALYTRDFFELLRSRLRSGGLAAAWVPLRGQPPFGVLRSVFASFSSVFPESSLWVFDAMPTHFGILIGLDKPQAIAWSRLIEVFSRPAIAADLAEIGLDDPHRWAASLALDSQALRTWCRDAPQHTDDRPVVEFEAPLEGGDDASAYTFLQALPPAGPPVLSGVPAADLGAIAERLRERPWLLAGHKAFLAGDTGRARGFYLRALRAGPSDRAVRTLLGLPAEPPAGSLAPEEALRQGAIRLLEGRASEARGTFEKLVARSMDEPRALLGLGLAEWELGDSAAARDRFWEVLSHRASRQVHAQALLGWLASAPGGLASRLLRALTFLEL